MITRYEERKKQVLDRSKEFKDIVIQFRDFNNVLTPSILKKIDDIYRQAAKIEKDIFILMVVGESNSGKSTFINAYLGGEILPMDVKQCTNSIINISYNEVHEIGVEYADKRRLRITSMEEVISFLKEHASLSDDYRDIPISTINQELLIKYEGKPGENNIKDFIQGVKEDNINNLPEDVYEKQIRDYINQYAKDWKKIVTKINVGWPLSEGLRNITIVDSPGVNAKGLVGEITEKYIEDANAVLFTKSLSGQALESKSFVEFIKNKSLDKHKSTLFLILTRAADFSTNELNTLFNQATDLYSKLSKDQILMVDNKVQLVLNRCLQMEMDDEIDSYLQGKADSELEGDILVRAMAYAWFVTDRRDRTRFEESMYRLSGFRQIQNSLEKFARAAQDLALFILLDDMEKIYVMLIAKLNEQVELLRIGFDDIDELKRQIAIKKEEIEKIKDKLFTVIDKITREYIAETYKDDNGNKGVKGIIWKERDKRLLDFRKRLKECHLITDLQNEMLKAVSGTEEYTNDISDSIIKKCNNELIALTNDSTSIDFTFLEPSFTEENFKDISASTKANANEKKDVKETTGGFCPKEVTVTRSYYSLEKHCEEMCKILLNNMDKISMSLAGNVYDYVMELTSVYKEKLREKSQEKKVEYNKLIEQLKNLKATSALIDQYEQYIAKIEKLKLKLAAIKGGIGIGQVNNE